VVDWGSDPRQPGWTPCGPQLIATGGSRISRQGRDLGPSRRVLSHALYERRVVHCGSDPRQADRDPRHPTACAAAAKDRRDACRRCRDAWSARLGRSAIQRNGNSASSFTKRAAEPSGGQGRCWSGHTQLPPRWMKPWPPWTHLEPSGDRSRRREGALRGSLRV
jgi:hypothetical protein